MIKDEEIYNPFDTTGLLDRPPGVAITDKSGAAGLVMWMQRHRPELAAGLSKRDPRLLTILAAVEREYDDGRVTSLADSEVDAWGVAGCGGCPRRPNAAPTPGPSPNPGRGEPGSTEVTQNSPPQGVGEGPGRGLHNSVVTVSTASINRVASRSISPSETTSGGPIKT
jgi:hypothetical protein